MAMQVHEVTISRADLDEVLTGKAVSVRTDKGLAVQLTREQDEPADRANVDGRGTVWVPVTEFMVQQLRTSGSTGFSPNYTVQISSIGIHLEG